MAKFTSASIEAMIYDFTGIPSDIGKGMCKGKGVVPEPTQARLTAYQNGMRELFNIPDDADAEATQQATQERIEKATEEDAEETLDKLMALTAELCQNTPSHKELQELPPRYRAAFLAWIHEEIANPEALSADTRR